MCGIYQFEYYKKWSIYNRPHIYVSIYNEFRGWEYYLDGDNPGWDTNDLPTDIKNKVVRYAALMAFI